eukprot:scaffold13305_cov124-Isochrysis_galbana.AAC.1
MLIPPGEGEGRKGGGFEVAPLPRVAGARHTPVDRERDIDTAGVQMADGKANVDRARRGRDAHRVVDAVFWV